MNKFLEALPFVLLLVLVPFFYYNSPNIAQSLIILSVSGLCGYRYFLMDKKQPDYRKLFADELHRIERESKELKENYGKITIQEMKKKEFDNFKF